MRWMTDKEYVIYRGLAMDKDTLKIYEEKRSRIDPNSTIMRV